MFIKTLILALFIIFQGSKSFATFYEIKTLESINQLTQSPKVKGFAFVVTDHEGDIMFQKYHGYGNPERKMRVSKRTMFESGSLAKMFTAIAIAKLEANNQINPKNPASQYLPKQYSFLPKKITVSDLIHHTSGIPDYLNLAALELNQMVANQTYVTNDWVLQYIKSHKINKEEVGVKFQYSNSNYVLLAEMIENVSGMKYEDFMLEFVFRPAGMKHAFVRKKSTKYDVYEAKPYYENVKVDNKYYYMTKGDFGIQFSIEDMIAFVKYIDQNEYIKNILLDDHGKYGYGYGIRHEKIGVFDVIYHKGMIKGAMNFFSYNTENKTFAIYLSNASDLADNQVINQKMKAIISDVEAVLIGLEIADGW